MGNSLSNPNGVGKSDEKLLKLIAERDEAALSKLYDLKSGFVYSLALRMVKNKLDAEEITGEVFFRIWEKAGNFDIARGNVMAWLTTITRRLTIDKIRSKQFKSSEREISIETTGAVNIGGSDDGYNFIINEQVNKALNNLDESHREVLRLSYYEGLSHSKIADHTSLPLGTVKTRIRDAVRQLREVLLVED